MEEKQILEITTEENYNEVLKSGIPTIIKVGAEWCGPCKVMRSTLEEVRKKYDETDLIVGEVDIDEFPDIAEKFGIRNIPVTLFFNKTGDLETRLVGSVQLKSIEECIALICKKEEEQ